MISDQILTKRWYALSLRSRYEKRAHRLLSEKGVDAFLPLIEEVHFWSDRRKKVLEPLFRGYLFVRTDLSDMFTILQTSGVVRFVGVGNRPSPIPDREIDWVRLAAGGPSKVKREPYLASGCRVRVTGGPFLGIEGIVTEVKGSMRVVVSVESIAQSISVEVIPHFVEKSELRQLPLRNEDCSKDHD